jgi:hypothetical protein
MRKKSERKRGHKNMRKHIMRRKLVLEVAKKVLMKGKWPRLTQD